MVHHMLLSSEPPQCDHRPVVEKINQAHELAVQLRALLLPSLQVGSSGAELVQEILDELVKRLASSLFTLHSQSRQSEEKGNNTTCEKRKNCCQGRKRKGILNDGHKRKNKMQNSWSKTSSVPFEDGYLWRKYGQKNIHGAKYPRSYYRCIYSDDQGCPARKTVEQEDIDEYPPKFTVVNIMQHTCQSLGSRNTNIASVMESGSASFQIPPPSSGSRTTVDNNDNNNTINTRSGFSSDDGEITHQLLSELLGQEMPLGSVGFGLGDDETVVHNTSSPLADYCWLDINNNGKGFLDSGEEGPFDDSESLW